MYKYQQIQQVFHSADIDRNEETKRFEERGQRCAPEKSNRIDVVSETYRKGLSGKSIKGISKLKDIVSKYNNEDEQKTEEIVTGINDKLGIFQLTQTFGPSSSTEVDPKSIFLYDLSDEMVESSVAFLTPYYISNNDNKKKFVQAFAITAWFSKFQKVLHLEFFHKSA